MILKGAEVVRAFARPDPPHPGLLLCGDDAMRVALKRAEVVLALIGPEGDAEMRLTRLPASDLRRTPAGLGDAMRASGFFPGPRAVVVEDATDTHTPAIAAALDDWRTGDARLIVTAGMLTARSTLRKLFEGHASAAAAVLYDNPPTEAEIARALTDAGLTGVAPDAAAEIAALAQALEPGDFRQMLERIALYKWRDAGPLTGAEVVALAPSTIEAEVDTVVHAAAEFEQALIPALLRRLEGQGTQAVTLCIRTLMHFRSLHLVAADPATGLARARASGPRRDRMQRQAQAWGTARLETALSLLVETDLTLRSASRAPPMAVMERTLMRLAMMRR